MKWFKEVTIDILVTVVILLAVILKIDWLGFLVTGYTCLILFARIIVVFNKSSFVQKKLSTKVPDWFFHLNYAFNSVLLLIHQWWFTGIAWLVIWMLSYFTLRKTKKS